ncbi:hypothetical protein [Bradyrhizobium australafricanum]|nr:hypothetical protein [Bradyrhizobium australafricanum]MCA6105481.1 hypothetical protein [Bradyrhizobium australafricanum]
MAIAKSKWKHNRSYVLADYFGRRLVDAPPDVLGYSTMLPHAFRECSAL